MVLDNVSWGELFIIVGVGVSFIGRRDLPDASKYLGRQVGRVVGLLVGGRQRLDMYTANNELSKLQNELRMGLRELDAIKTEMALASSVGMKQLGGSTIGSSKTHNASSLVQRNPILSSSHSTSSNITIHPAPTSTVSGTMPPTSHDIPTTTTSFTGTSPEVSTPSLSMRAIAEDEWNKRGIGFKSRAEQGTATTTMWTPTSANTTFPEPSRHRLIPPTVTLGGAAILAELIQNNLIYDQYDRVLQEREEILRPKPTTNNADLTNDFEN